MSSKMILDAIGFVPAKGTSFGEAVQNLTELSDITVFQDKQIRLVEDVGLMYRFDAESFSVADGTDVIRPGTLASENPGRWFVLKPIVVHALTSNRDADDHTQYVHNDIARLISAVHAFNPTTETAAFILGENAVGQKIVGLNADQLDGFDSSAFVKADTLGVANGVATLDANGNLVQAQYNALENGMPGYVDSNSGLLISMTTIGVNFALVTSGTRNVYMNNLGDIPSNTMGFILPRNAVLISVVVAISTNAGNNTNASFQIRKNDSLTPLLSFPLLSGTSRRIFLSQSLPFTAGDEIQCYIASGQNVPNPTMFLEFAWRN